ncbi:MAG: hypothetical protein Q7T71_04885 [Herbiconiux sp.]|nr:hypothetical protein [Herbiconiux sp.]
MTDPLTRPASVASSALRASGAPSITRRSVVVAGVWALPVVALAAAAPAVAASGGDPRFDTSGPLLVPGDSNLLAFLLSVSDLPAVPAAEEGDLAGVTIALCLPEGLQVVSVDGPSWGFAATADDFEGGEVFVFNTVALPASSSDFITITVREGPGYVGLNGELGADVVIAGTDFFTAIAWQYAYPGEPAAPLPNCSAGRTAPR